MNQYWKLLTTAFVILLMAVSLTSCDFDKKDGDWDPMKWARTDYRETVVDRISYYDVPASGGTFTFRCTNYNSFWLAGTSVKDEKGKTEHLYHEEGDYNNITNSLITERVEGNMLTVTFPATESVTLRFIAVVTAGDIFHTFRFKQS